MKQRRPLCSNLAHERATRCRRLMYWLVMLLLCTGAVAAQLPVTDDEPATDVEPMTDEEPVEMEEGLPFEEPLPITTTVFLEGNATEQRLEIVIHRWSVGPPPEAPEGQDSETVEQPSMPEPGPQTFVVSVARQPSFVQNITWIDGPEVVFEPDEVDKTVTLQFDTAAEGETDEHEEDAELVLHIKAGEETIEPPDQELVIPLHFTRAPELEEPAVSICALKADAPEELPIVDAVDFCDPERVPVLKYDRIVVFFTPNRDLREPIGEAQSFQWEIVSPTDKVVIGGSFWNRGTEEEPELTREFTREGSPGRFAVELELWDAGDDPDPALAEKGPGTYTVRTVAVKLEPTGVFGGGDLTPVSDGEWQDEGTFEIEDPVLHFKGFVAEQVRELYLPFDPSLREGDVSFGEPQVDGTRVSIDLDAHWRWHTGEPESVASRLVLELPDALRPGYEEAGLVTASLERRDGRTDAVDIFFTAGLFDPVATTVKPPNRSLASHDASPPLWEVARGLREERHAAPDGSSCYQTWVWTQGDMSPLGRPGEATSGRCPVVYHGTSRHGEAWGAPARDLASHLHDPETLVVIPVFYALRGGGGQQLRLDLRAFAYALYGTGSETYDGPPPVEAPTGGNGPPALPVLKLLEIEGTNLLPEMGFAYGSGQPGFTHSGVQPYSDGSVHWSYVESVALAGLPLEVRLGEAARFAADAAKSATPGPETQCDYFGGANGRLHAASIFGGAFKATGYFEAPCPPDAPGAASFRSDPRPKGGGSASLQLQLTPVSEVERGASLVDFYYRSQSSYPAEVEGPSDKEGVLFTWDYQYETTPEGLLAPGVEVPRESFLRVSAHSYSLSHSVSAYYGPVHSLDEGIDPVPPYNHPAGAIAPPPGADVEPTETPSGIDEMGDADPDELEPEDEVPGPDGPLTPGDEEGPGGSETPGDRPEGDRIGGPVVIPGTGVIPDTGVIDPNAPDIAALIRHWLAIAEPPENAVIGADFYYNDWGVKLGKAPGGIIRGTPGRPDDVGARTSTEYVWGLRDALDSVDHCTVGEYVDARLAGSAFHRCMGRYMGMVQQLTTLARSSAETKVRQMKWVPVIMNGDPASSQQQAGTVQRQDPPAGTRLSRGEAVQLWIYGEPAPELLTVPDLTGSSSRMATAWVEDLGLVPMLRPGSAAASAQQTGAVERQEPPPGRQVEIGSVVTLTVYREPVPYVPPTPRPAVNDCSRWPGSVAVWDTASNTSRCDCPDGLRWNATGSGCEPAVNTDQLYCDSNWPGTAARRDPATGALECQCPAGLGWDDHARACVAVSTVTVQPILPGQTADCRNMPGTIAQRDASGRVQCRCPVGSWDAAQRRCVTEALPTLDPPGCTARYAHIRGFLALGRVADAQREVQAARAEGCNPEYIDEAFPPGTDSGPGTGTGTGGGECENIGRSLSEPLFQGRITRQQAEQQMVAAGCGNELDSLCPSGNFGQNVYPDCLGQVYVGPGPSGGGSGGGGSTGPTCFIQEYGARSGVGLVMAARWGQHTNYYVMAVPDDEVDAVMRSFKEQHGAWLVASKPTYERALGEARRLCANPTRAPGG